MNFDHKHIIPRYTFVIILLTLVGVAVVVSAGYQMFFQQSYWERVRERLASPPFAVISTLPTVSCW